TGEGSAAPLVAGVQAEQRGGIDPRGADGGRDVQVRTGRSPRGPDQANRLASVYEIVLGHRDLVEMEVGRVKAETVIDDDEPPREEEVCDECDSTGVESGEGRGSLRGVGEAPVGREEVSVDDRAD